MPPTGKILHGLKDVLGSGVPLHLLVKVGPDCSTFDWQVCE